MTSPCCATETVPADCERCTEIGQMDCVYMGTGVSTELECLSCSEQHDLAVVEDHNA